MKVTVTTAISKPLGVELLRIYRSAFDPLAELSPVRQSLTDQEFWEEMNSADVLKFILWDQDEQAAGISLLATDLNAVPWLSPPFFQKRFPTEYAEGKIYYIGAMAIDPTRHSGLWFAALLRAVIERAASDNCIICLDFCKYNVEVVPLQKSVLTTARRLGVTPAWIDLDHQQFSAMTMDGRT